MMIYESDIEACVSAIMTARAAYPVFSKSWEGMTYQARQTAIGEYKVLLLRVPKSLRHYVQARHTYEWNRDPRPITEEYIRSQLVKLAMSK